MVGILPSAPGGTYPAAALARSLIASISSFVFDDLGIGMCILVTGNGTARATIVLDVTSLVAAFPVGISFVGALPDDGRGRLVAGILGRDCREELTLAAAGCFLFSVLFLRDVFDDVSTCCGFCE